MSNSLLVTVYQNVGPDLVRILVKRNKKTKQVLAEWFTKSHVVVGTENQQGYLKFDAPISTGDLIEFRENFYLLTITGYKQVSLIGNFALNKVK